MDPLTAALIALNTGLELAKVREQNMQHLPEAERTARATLIFEQEKAVMAFFEPLIRLFTRQRSEAMKAVVAHMQQAPEPKPSRAEAAEIVMEMARRMPTVFQHEQHGPHLPTQAVREEGIA